MYVYFRFENRYVIESNEDKNDLEWTEDLATTKYSAVSNKRALWNNRVGLPIFEIKIIM